MSTVRANSITNSAGTGAPDFPNGLTSGGVAVTPGAQTFTASEAITAGNPVAINSDGTVSKIALSTGALLKQFFMPSVKATNTLNEYASVARIPGLSEGFLAYSPLSISDTVFVSTFTDGPAGPVKSRLVTISNGIMSPGTAVSSGLTNTSGAAVFHVKASSNKFAIFTTAGTTGTMVIGEVSGSTITFGTPVTVWSGVVSSINAVLGDGNGGLLLAQNTGATNNPLRVCAISVTGTTPTVGAFTTLRSTAPGYYNPVLAYDPVNSVFLLTAWQQTTPWSIWSWGITISGTTIAVGSQTNAFGSESAFVDYPVLSYDEPTGRFVAITPSVTSTSSRIYTATVSSSRVITVSPQTTDFAYVNSSALKTTPNKTMLLGSASSNTASVVTFDAGNSYKPILTALQFTFADDKFWQSTSAGNSGFYGLQSNTASTGITYFGYGFSNVDKLVGIANDSVASGQPVNVAVNGGLASGLSGLSVSSQYFTNGSGGVTTYASASFLGVATSATEILLNTERV